MMINNVKNSVVLEEGDTWEGRRVHPSIVVVKL